MRLGTTALAASALTGLLYLTAPSASALPAPSRADVAKAPAAGIAQEVHWRGRGYRRWGGYRGYRRGYGYGYGYPYYGYGYGGGYPYYYRPYYYGGYGYPYYRRRGFGIYLGY